MGSADDCRVAAEIKIYPVDGVAGKQFTSLKAHRSLRPSIYERSLEIRFPLVRHGFVNKRITRRPLGVCRFSIEHVCAGFTFARQLRPKAKRAFLSSPSMGRLYVTFFIRLAVAQEGGRYR